MYVKLKNSLFNEESEFGKLDRIFHYFEDGKHFWLIENDLDFDQVLKSVWLNSHLDRVKSSIDKFLERAFVEANNTPTSVRKNRVIVYVTNTKDDEGISLDIAVSYLGQPLYLLVENEISDASFFNCICNQFRGKGKKIRKALENNWIRYYNAGGKAMVLKILNHRLNNDSPFPYRFFVLVDSDKPSPSIMPEDTQRLIDFCKDKNIPFHVLEKREIENYIPRQTLWKIPSDLHPVVVTI